MPTIKKPYADHPRHGLDFSKTSLTHQSFKAECDINNIMRKFEKTRLLDHVNQHQGSYGDYLGYEDYQTSLNQIRDAQTAFLTVPAKIRAQFENDPAKFLRFVQDPANADSMVQMGLARRPKTPPDPNEGKGEAPAPQGASDAS